MTKLATQPNQRATEGHRYARDGVAVVKRCPITVVYAVALHCLRGFAAPPGTHDRMFYCDEGPSSARSRFGRSHAT